MNYFFIEKCLDDKIVGTIPQQKKLIVRDAQSSNFIGNIRDRPISGSTELPICEIFERAIFTDLIDAGGVGFTDALLINSTLKNTIEQFNHFGIQFLSTGVIRGNIENKDYWQIHVSSVAMQLIDFKNSVIVEKGRKKDRQYYYKEIKADSLSEFESYNNQLIYPQMATIKEVVMKPESDIDFFALDYTEGGLKYIVSNKLKNQIESDNLTGIEFRPIETSYSYWVSKDGPREIVYGRAY